MHNANMYCNNTHIAQEPFLPCHTVVPTFISFGEVCFMGSLLISVSCVLAGVQFHTIYHHIMLFHTFYLSFLFVLWRNLDKSWKKADGFHVMLVTC